MTSCIILSIPRGLFAHKKFFLPSFGLPVFIKERWPVFCGYSKMRLDKCTMIKCCF
jgi:hypothetical protein